MHKLIPTCSEVTDRTTSLWDSGRIIVEPSCETFWSLSHKWHSTCSPRRFHSWDPHWSVTLPSGLMCGQTADAVTEWRPQQEEPGAETCTAVGWVSRELCHECLVNCERCMWKQPSQNHHGTAGLQIKYAGPFGPVTGPVSWCFSTSASALICWSSVSLLFSAESSDPTLVSYGSVLTAPVELKTALTSCWSVFYNCFNTMLSFRFWGWSGLCFKNDWKEMIHSADRSKNRHWLSSLFLCPLLFPPTLFQDRETGQRDYEGNGGAPHRGPLCAQRGLQVFCRPAGLHQSPEPEQRSLHPDDSGLHSPQELLCNIYLSFIITTCW